MMGDSGVGRRVVLVSGAPGAGKSALATARYNGRAATRHPVHVVDTMSAELAAEFDQPIGLGELVVVDTSVPVDVARVVDKVLARFPASRHHDRTVVR